MFVAASAICQSKNQIINQCRLIIIKKLKDFSYICIHQNLLQLMLVTKSWKMQREKSEDAIQNCVKKFQEEN